MEVGVRTSACKRSCQSLTIPSKRHSACKVCSVCVCVCLCVCVCVRVCVNFHICAMRKLCQPQVLVPTRCNQALRATQLSRLPTNTLTGAALLPTQATLQTGAVPLAHACHGSHGSARERETLCLEGRIAGLCMFDHNTRAHTRHNIPHAGSGRSTFRTC